MINFLRMIIHQNPLLEATNNIDMKRFCAEISIKTVDAISIFTQTFPSSHTYTYCHTATLIKCIYQIMPFLKDRARSEVGKAALKSVRKARKLLSDLPPSAGSTKCALFVLETIDIEDDNGLSFDNVNSDVRSYANTQNEVQPQQQAHDAIYISLPDAPNCLNCHLKIGDTNTCSQFCFNEQAVSRATTFMGENPSPQFPVFSFDFTHREDVSHGQAEGSADSEYLKLSSVHEFSCTPDMIWRTH
jgi:hypothetical protein